MFKTTPTEEFFKPAIDFFTAVPRTPEDLKIMGEKVQSVLKTEYKNSQDVMKTYQKSFMGDATANELADANKKAIELVKATTFAGILAMPGAIFFLPTIVKTAKTYKLDIVPKSVATEFNI